MGIKYFFSWFRKNFPNRIISLRYNNPSSKLSVDIDNLLIDLNGIFHNAAQTVYKYGEIKSLLRKPRPPNSKDQLKTFELIWEEILQIVNLGNPQKRLLLCIDGVAPLSKQNQQRQRRFKSVKDKQPEQFDSNCITPGTRFMDHLSKFLDFKIKNELSTNPKWKNLEILFSNEKVPGEGEHKLMNFVRKFGDPHESFCIHGMDADLIMLALATHKNKFHILRENHRNRSEVFHINLEDIRLDLIKFLRWNDTNYLVNEDSLIDDFVLMLFSVGNDFLPHLPCIDILEGGIEILIESYLQNCEKHGHLTYRIGNRGIFFDQKSFSEYLRILGNYEKSVLENKITLKGSYTPEPLLEKHTKIVDGKYTINFEEYKKDYYLSKFGSELPKLAQSYIEGLQWVLSYYTNGVPNWKWFYPGYYAIFSSDLADYVSQYKHKIYEPTKPLTPFEQLLCVLPPYSSNLLPKPLSDLLESKNSVLAKYYPREFKIDMEGKRNDWEGIAILPMINIEDVRKNYLGLVGYIDEIDKKRNIVGAEYIYVYDENFSYEVKTYYGNIKNCRVRIEKK